MPVEFETESEETQETGTTGKGLRGQLEAQLAANKALADKLRSYEVLETVGKFDLVSADDLEGVEAEDLEQRATEIQTERTALRVQVAKDLLKAQGVDEADLDSKVTDLLAGSEDATQAFARVRQTAEVAGNPTPAVNPESLHGIAAIAAGVKG